MTSLPDTLPTLRGPGVRLRAWAERDVPAVVAAGEDPLIPAITSVVAHGTEADALTFVARQHERLTSGAGYSFAITDDTDRCVGQVGLWLRDHDLGRVSLGYWIVPDERRRGYAYTALRTITEWGATLPGVVRLELYVEPWNTGSCRTAERVGFTREGLCRRWQRVGGVPRDMYLYAALAEEVSASASPR